MEGVGGVVRLKHQTQGREVETAVGLHAKATSHLLGEVLTLQCQRLGACCVYTVGSSPPPSTGEGRLFVTNPLESDLFGL